MASADEDVKRRKVDAPADIVRGFGGATDGSLTWFCDPTSWPEPAEGTTEGGGGHWSVDEATGSLVIAPPSKKDFW